jgi:hypothetical protein
MNLPPVDLHDKKILPVYQLKKGMCWFFVH